MIAAATASSRRLDMKNNLLSKDVPMPSSPGYLDDPNSLALQNISFTKKLFDMLSDNNNREIITWNKDGLSFEVLDPKALERDVLPRYFRHSRFQSLVRQLNFYNFKKVGKERSSWIYTHEYFQRGKPDLLESLKRKTNTSAFVPTDSNYAYRITVRPSNRTVRTGGRSEGTGKRSDSISTTASDILKEESDDHSDDDTSGESEEISCVSPQVALHKKSPKIHITLGSPTAVDAGWTPLITPRFQVDAIEHFLGQEASELCYSSLLQRISTSSNRAKELSRSMKVSGDEEEVACDDDATMHKGEMLLHIESLAHEANLPLNFLLDLLVLLLNLKDLLSISTFHSRNKQAAVERLECRILEHLHSRQALSWEVLQYMEALNYPINQLPYFKVKSNVNTPLCSLKKMYPLDDEVDSMDTEGSAGEEDVVSSVFEGKLLSEQRNAIVSHFLRMSLNMLQYIRAQFLELNLSRNTISAASSDDEDAVDVNAFLCELRECHLCISSFYDEISLVK